MSRLPVVKGTLDLLVLRALSWTPMHGFEIVSWLERAANGSLDIEDSRAVSGGLPPRGAWAAQSGMGRDREQPSSEILHAHGGGTRASQRRNAELGGVRRHRDDDSHDGR